MGKVVMSLQMSLDGFFERPDGGIDWHLVDEELHGYFNDVLGAMSGFLTGRVTHDLMAQFWPTADREPDCSPTMAEFARIWRDMPKHAYSRTEDRSEWNTTTWRDVVPAEVEKLKEGGDLVVGGPNLASSFRAHDLIDEYHVYVHPVIIGSGRPAFPDGPPTDLRQLGARTFGNGVVGLRYGR